jgi:DNA-binding NarL/FixJ family response regulator
MSYDPSTGRPRSELPRLNVLLLKSDPVAAGTLHEAVREVLPDAIIHTATVIAQARLLLMAARPDLAVANLNLVSPSLRDFIAEGEHRNAAFRVIVVAGHGDDDRVLPALHAGAGGFVVTHDGPAQLVAQLRDLVAGVIPLTPSLARQIIRHLDWSGHGAAFSGAELELLTWVAAGDTPAQAGARMQAGEDEVRILVRRVYWKLRLPPGEIAPASAPRERRHGCGS